MSFHPQVMPPVQQSLLHRLAPLVSREGYSLGGGTGVAVLAGHRRSFDLDWFTEGLGDPLTFARLLQNRGVELEVQSTAAGTLHGMVDGVRLSFLEYRYPNLEPVAEWPEYGCGVLSPTDLACMKLSAIVSRGAKRDFIDLFALERSGLPLARMLTSYRRKFGIEDVAHVAISLTYFDDADAEETPEMLWNVEWDEVKRTVEGWVQDYASPEKGRRLGA